MFITPLQKSLGGYHIANVICVCICVRVHVLVRIWPAVCVGDGVPISPASSPRQIRLTVKHMTSLSQLIKG